MNFNTPTKTKSNKIKKGGCYENQLRKSKIDWNRNCNHDSDSVLYFLNGRAFTGASNILIQGEKHEKNRIFQECLQSIQDRSNIDIPRTWNALLHRTDSPRQNINNLTHEDSDSGGRNSLD